MERTKYVIIENGTRGACDGLRAKDYWGKPHQAFKTKEEALATVDKMNVAVMTYIQYLIPPFSVAELGDDGEPILPPPPTPPPPLPPPQWEVRHHGRHLHYCHLQHTGSEWVRSANAAHAVRHPGEAPYSLVEVAR